MHVKNPPSCSETVTDHVTSLSFSFGCFAFVIDCTWHCHFARVIVVDSISFVWFYWEMNVWFSKKCNFNAVMIIILWKFVICKLKKRRMFGGNFFTMSHLTICSFWILCGLLFNTPTSPFDNMHLLTFDWFEYK